MRGFCDDSTKALVIKSVTMGGDGVKNYQTLRDIVYGWPLRRETMSGKALEREIKEYEKERKDISFLYPQQNIIERFASKLNK